MQAEQKPFKVTEKAVKARRCQQNIPCKWELNKINFTAHRQQTDFSNLSDTKNLKRTQ